MRSDRNRDRQAEGDVRVSPAGDGSDAVDAVFDALSDERRRFVLRYVIDRPGGVSLDELVDRMDDRGHGTDGGGAGRHDRGLIRGELYHTHLPKLDEVDVVEFDRVRGTVHPGADGRRLDLCRDLIARVDR